MAASSKHQVRAISHVRLKNVLGFRQFSLRGLHRVRAEWKLVCMALNLRRMAVLSAG